MLTFSKEKEEDGHCKNLSVFSGASTVAVQCTVFSRRKEKPRNSSLLTSWSATCAATFLFQACSKQPLSRRRCPTAPCEPQEAALARSTRSRRTPFSCSGTEHRTKTSGAFHNTNQECCLFKPHTFGKAPEHEIPIECHPRESLMGGGEAAVRGEGELDDPLRVSEHMLGHHRGGREGCQI